MVFLKALHSPYISPIKVYQQMRRPNWQFRMNLSEEVIRSPVQIYLIRDVLDVAKQYLRSSGRPNSILLPLPDNVHGYFSDDGRYVTTSQTQYLIAKLTVLTENQHRRSHD